MCFSHHLTKLSHIILVGVSTLLSFYHKQTSLLNPEWPTTTKPVQRSFCLQNNTLTGTYDLWEISFSVAFLWQAPSSFILS